MELNWNNFLLKTSNLITMSSYIKGTLIFTLFTISNNRNENILLIGLYFVGIALIINTVVLFASLWMIFYTEHKNIKQKLWAAIAFQFANIPIAIAYFYFVINENGF
jgi:sulfite exporter TauE/SafE